MTFGGNKDSSGFIDPVLYEAYNAFLKSLITAEYESDPVPIAGMAEMAITMSTNAMVKNEGEAIEILMDWRSRIEVAVMAEYNDRIDVRKRERVDKRSDELDVAEAQRIIRAMTKSIDLVIIRICVFSLRDTALSAFSVKGQYQSELWFSPTKALVLLRDQLISYANACGVYIDLGIPE